jgi:hypothetical protein
MLLLKRYAGPIAIFLAGMLIIAIPTIMSSIGSPLQPAAAGQALSPAGKCYGMGILLLLCSMAFSWYIHDRTLALEEWEKGQVKSSALPQQQEES